MSKSELATSIRDEVEANCYVVSDMESEMEFRSIDNLTLTSFNWDGMEPTYDIDSEDADIEGITFGKYNQHLVIDADELEEYIKAALPDDREEPVTANGGLFTKTQLELVELAIVTALKGKMVVAALCTPTGNSVQEVEMYNISQQVTEHLTDNGIAGDADANVGDQY